MFPYMDSDTQYEIGQIVRIKPQPPALPYDAIVCGLEFHNDRVLVEFSTGLVATQRDWVTPDMIEIPR